MKNGSERNRPRSIFNRCNCPAWAIADLDFQYHPKRIEIGRVREDNRRLFETLDGVGDAGRRGEIFHEYLSVQFALHQWPSYERSSRRSLRNSYVRYLRGWSVDSNSVEGAVLKGWVESRMGIPATYHHGPLAVSEENAYRFAVDRVRGSAFTNAIEGQLDLLYEFCQYELRRRRPGREHITLFRGTFDAQDYPARPGRDARHAVVTLNNLSSFTADRECAWEFGSTVWQVEVPVAKVFFFADLLPESILRGEEEYLVIGGEYEVRKLLF